MELSVYHNSHDLLYRNPFGAVECGRKIIFRLKTSCEFPVEACYLRLWEAKGEKTLTMNLISGVHAINLEPCLYEVEYEAPVDPGLVWYYFVIRTGSRTFYYGNNSARLGGEGHLSQEEHPPGYQITVYHFSKVPGWYKQGVMYQIFVDRFKKGQQNNCDPYSRRNSLLHLHWEDTPVYIKDEKGNVTYWDFFGGNLAGVIEKLPYLKELGISIIYFNPIFESSSNHKYDTADYLRIDPAFGDEAIFTILVQKAKSFGISVILDGVFSHTGSDSIYFNKYGNYPGLGAYQSTDSPYFNWYEFKQTCDIYECWWNIEALPEVKEMNPSYRHFIYGSENSVISKWMTKGIAGWRLDVADELPDEFIQELRMAVKDNNPEAVLIGEVWEDASHKESYGQLRQYFWGDELDATMNYPWRKMLLQFLLGQGDSALLHAQILSLYENYPRENFYAAMNLIGSHDKPRILTVLGEAPSERNLSENERRIYKLPPSARCLAVQRLKLLSLVQMTFPGVPCIYYGDEAGLEGYSDPYNRGTYPWGQEDREILDWYKKIIRLRAEYEILQSGDFQSFYYTSDVYGYKRRGKDEEITVLINRHPTQAKEVNFKSGIQSFPFTIDLLSGEVISWGNERGDPVNYKDSLTIKINPISARTIWNKKTDSVFRKNALKRSCGVLMSISSLPSALGTGELGREAYDFVDFLADSQQSIWQVLPLNPTGLGDSPYQSDSAFAGNPMLINLEYLIQEGMSGSEQFKDMKILLESKNSRESVNKDDLLRNIFQVFQTCLYAQEEAFPVLKKAETNYLSLDNYLAFQKENAVWLDDYALFRALKIHFGNVPWYDWEQGIALRTKESIAKYSLLLAREIEFNRFLQYTFFFQWQAIRQYAQTKDIKVIGDIPLFVAADSCDVWVNRNFFVLKENGKPAKVAGVPPDYFSETGQLWGNPLYDWEALATDNYSWWKERIRLLLKLYDFIRIDHFRGLEAYWEIEAGAETAAEGHWMKGPGKRFLESLSSEYRELPFIAEDLGFITPEVNNLKNIFGLPGMKILQFTSLEECLAEKDNNFVYYTGTHDNDTLLGWIKTKSNMINEDKQTNKNLTEPEENAKLKTVCRKLMEDLYMSPAAWAILPMQDILCLDTDSRMNIPGTIENNWKWQMTESMLTGEVKTWLRNLALKSGRSSD
ncbi:MAG: bifunctional glycogen debranching protein GlgX/4-alpha-glucanotransferase [Desulfitobacteriaceae bacterium]|nr:bifunctional glycogen debranching protein GlgX/4-alpha-glucanotransferase [Desulfitobacteriaceae bacterium]MDD4346327.1 bifunctional glycogen debranching protein GlgX/4-alpha-glucanotransferase [Desulfitobacteriaceae bacterium]